VKYNIKQIALRNKKYSRLHSCVYYDMVLCGKFPHTHNNSTVMVVRKCALFEKKKKNQEQIMICSWKSNFFDTFSALDLNPNENRTLFRRVQSHNTCGHHCPTTKTGNISFFGSLSVLFCKRKLL
jgi:hypothetical protein